MLNPEQAFEEAKKERDKANLTWKIFFVAMLLFLLEIPLPPIQPWMAFSGAIIFFALMGHFFYRAKRLPMHEALLLAQIKDGTLTQSMLCIELELDPTDAKVLLYKMEQSGLLHLDENVLYEDGDMLYKLKGYKTLS